MKQLQAVLIIAVLFVTGCATGRPWYNAAICSVAGAAVGAGIGAGAEGGKEAGYGAAAGAVAAGLLCAALTPKAAPDSDGDGVPDSIDKCPNTQVGVKVDADGCPLDSDKDGVPDYKDRCPNTPAGVKVDATGCPLDSDGDGVPDYLDKCPNTPAGMKVDATGCPLDSDGDGVPDYKDQCPGTPASVQVNQLGCPKREPIVLKGVNFEFNSAVLTPQSLTILDGVAEILTKHPDVQVTIAGHTDSVGTAPYNKKLSQRRAESVRNHLISRGVNAANLTAVGFGEEQPIASNDEAEGRAKNRRVELQPKE
ncbi:MAG: flagellar motor protein MotB [Candidatus Methylomirabilota bacterium]|nr:OmpA family protein [Candidatus Methylomirabilis sp.]PWB48558.1 MAG: flagellar motor protein MotB [candidate division NC10 bacterium]